MEIVSDTKDWTWVLDRPCPECGYDAARVDPATLPRAVRDNAVRWLSVLSHDDASARPAEGTWSPTEYACHVRDVHRVFLDRLQQMLAADDPVFENWDQDATSVEQRYHLQDPREVAEELVEAAEAVAEEYGEIHGDQWRRPGRRSNGSLFTVESLGRYHLHDLVHHLHDVSG